MVDERELSELKDELLGYPQTNGTIELRETISDLYPGSDIDNVIVTNGTAEANFISILNLVEPGDEVVVMIPNYMQIWGLTRSLGAKTKRLLLHAERNWGPDLDELERLVNEKTRLIAICNPNNPTGSVMSERRHASRFAKSRVESVRGFSWTRCIKARRSRGRAHPPSGGGTTGSW